MQGLYDPARHEPLTRTPWSEAAARAAIARIAAAAEAEVEPAGCWPAHPLDEPGSPQERRYGLYDGAAGVIWALRDLALQRAYAPTRDFAALVPLLVARCRAELLARHPAEGTASYFMGEAGALLLHWSFTRQRSVADQLFAVVQGNLRHKSLEPLWGSPGTMLAAIHMAEASGEVRWMLLVQQAVQVLSEQMIIDPETDTWVWEQDLHGRRTRWLGAGHGFAGNLFAVLRAAALLDAQTVARFSDQALHTLSATALRSGPHANWHPMIDAARVAGHLPLVQDCHGAPGIVCRLAAVRRSAEWDALLRAAGELTWAAGPLSKGPCLCHGSAGSAMACLKLWRRFKEPLWLERARSLAMHALEQVERQRTAYGHGRHSLWSGDLGVACTLWNCIVPDDRFPTLDHF